MTISSPHNDRLKEIRKLARRRSRELTGRFVAEGEDLLAAADAAGWPALERYCAAGSGLDGVEVEPELLAGVSQLGSGTRALAVYEQRWADAPAGPLCVALHGISDPGNVGTILRSALAFGASSVALGPGCADPYGPKAVRASMGALFAVPLARVGALGADADESRSAAEPSGPGAGRAGAESSGPGAGRSGAESGRPDVGRAGAGSSRPDVGWPGAGPSGSDAGGGALVAALPGTAVALDAHGGVPLADVLANLDGSLTLVVGAERAGLPRDVLAACDRVARIPIASESLNAAMAATVALYEVTRGAVAAEHRMPPA